MRLPHRRRASFAHADSSRPRSGFTLAEVMVTIVIVGIALVLVLQGLNATKFEAAHTRNLKLSRELGLLTLGQIEAGLFQEDTVRDRLFGTYAEQGHEFFEYEVVFGDDGFLTEDELYRYDPWRREDDDEDEEIEEPYEIVQVKVTFPQIRGYKNELVLERWLPWDAVYPPEEGAQDNASEDRAGEDP